MSRFPFFFWGGLWISVGLAAYFASVLFAALCVALDVPPAVRLWNQRLVWYSGVPCVVGLLLIAIDLGCMLPRKRRGRKRTETEQPSAAGLTVVLTAYNDEESIGPSVRDFQAQGQIRRVIVVSNNSSDSTLECARQAGAIAVNEPMPGYGRCVYRCFQEALRFDDAELILLCEGDMTYRGADIAKFLAYLPHAGIVNGTRIVEQLRDYSTQLTTFMYYGNFFVGKLLEVKHLGKGTFTDAGTTYKLIRRETLLRLLPHLNPAINLEFNCHFLDTALALGENIVECPVTFHPRVGRSKGGNTGNLRAFRVGLAMMWGLAFGWRRR